MERLGPAFGSYRINHAVLVRAAWTMYHATWSQGTRVVYRGVSSTASRTVALWVSHVLKDVGAVAPAFLQQVGRTSGIDHPALAHVLDGGELDGRLYFSTRYMESMTLDELIRRGGRLTAGDALSLLTPVADGLDQAHDIGLVHGAISPSTIWVDSTSAQQKTAAVLTGYGLMALVRAYTLGGATDDVIPDVMYIAPEQLHIHDAGTDDERYALRTGTPDPGADQYALSCALYHCVAGRPPFAQDTAATLFRAHLRTRAARSGGDAVAHAIERGMAKQPADRHPSCLALVQSNRSDDHAEPLRATSGRAGHTDHGPPARHGTPTTTARTSAADRTYASRSRQRSGGSGVRRWVGATLLAGLLIVTVALLLLAAWTFFGLGAGAAAVQRGHPTAHTM